MIRSSNDKIGGAGTVARSYESIARIYIIAVNYNALSVQFWIFQIFGVWDLLINAAVRILAGVSTLGIKETDIDG